jgi:hypothetical protein
MGFVWRSRALFFDILQRKGTRESGPLVRPPVRRGLIGNPKLFIGGKVSAANLSPQPAVNNFGVADTAEALNPHALRVRLGLPAVESRHIAANIAKYRSIPLTILAGAHHIRLALDLQPLRGGLLLASLQERPGEHRHGNGPFSRRKSRLTPANRASRQAATKRQK